MIRPKPVAQSIVDAIQTPSDVEPKPLSLQRRLRLFLVLRRLRLVRCKQEVFQHLRGQWEVSERDYRASFRAATDLQSASDMGYSGSTFFTTENGSYIVKSVPRRFEHSFFRNDLLQPYATHMLANLDSLLIRITDFLAAESPSLGGALGLVPTHHIIMENLLFGRDQADNTGIHQWETWDLKPDSYFFPERDIAGGRLTSEDTKSKLADRFDGRILITQTQSESFLAHLETDTKLLAESNAVDYSLFLVRIPMQPAENPFSDPANSEASTSTPPPVQPPEDTPMVPPSPPTWRTGIKSKDGKYIFRAAILDFFWAKHKAHAKFMTLLINTWNLFGNQGPMSITTTPHEYRNRFLNMCRNIIEVQS